MQTVYQTISIRPRWEAPRAEEKIIDLAQYRRKLEREQRQGRGERCSFLSDQKGTKESLGVCLR